mmetsp:Transcript_12586/g.27680  ORF Transcript_12586/g.27680 Transcript_12586/m.27680 type:complete len:295 (+) Transcript_12586:293-1177(+)
MRRWYVHAKVAARASHSMTHGCRWPKLIALLTIELPRWHAISIHGSSHATHLLPCQNLLQNLLWWIATLHSRVGSLLTVRTTLTAYSLGCVAHLCTHSSLLGREVIASIHGTQILRHVQRSTAILCIACRFVGSIFGRLHGHSFTLLAFSFLFFGNLFTPFGHFHFVSLTKFCFFIHVLSAEFLWGFLPRLGQHFGKVRIGGVRMLSLQGRTALIAKRQKGRHGTFGRRGVFWCAFVGRHFPWTLIHGLFDLVSCLVLASLLFPDFLLFRIELAPCLRDQFGNVSGLFRPPLFG